MKTLMALGVLMLGVVLAPQAALAHCDAIDGPVATAAVRALDAKNVNLVLPFAPAEAEEEITAAYEQALVVRAKGPEAKALADRYFMETVVRLHRAGEKAAYTGLKPAGRDFGPAIPAAEKALASGELKPLVELLAHQVEHGLAEQFEHARHAGHGAVEPKSKADVPAARKRVSAELGFVGYAEGIYQATKGGHHAE
ncbi:MAG: DUF6448 family protein [Candidatus Methylomirabilales bacterium]